MIKKENLTYSAFSVRDRGEDIVGRWALSSLPAMTKNGQVVISGSYPVPI